MFSGEKMRKILYVASTVGHIRQFHLSFMKELKNLGYVVHVAAFNNLGDDEISPVIDKFYDISFSRSPLRFSNIKAYQSLKKIIKREKYDIITTHTPVGGMIGRLAARKARKKQDTKVFYTAHGFHFYQGSSHLSWLIYYNIEKFFAKHYTDIMFTINNEDYHLAQEKFKCQIVFQYGMGLDINRFRPISQKTMNQLRIQYKYNLNDIIILSIGELNKNKNHSYLIDLVSEQIVKNSHVKLLIAGSGPLKEQLKAKIDRLNLQNNVFLLGQRSDIDSLIALSDIIASVSFREGLPMNILESFGTAKAVFASNIRGHRDLIKNGYNGFLFKLTEKETAIEYLSLLIENKELREKFGENSFIKSKQYSIQSVNDNLLEYFK